MKAGLAAGILAMAAMVTAQAQQQGAALPDSPRPQMLPEASAVAPGKGASTSAEPVDPGAPTSALPSSKSTSAAGDADDTTAPDVKPELGEGGRVQTLHVNTNFVEVPFTVKDKKGTLVPGLTWRDVRVFENGVREQIRLFTVDPYPLSVAFVLDQSMPYQVMNRVNSSLGAVQGAFTPYDEMAVFTYSNGPRLRTDYTGAQSARISAVLEQSKSTGREMTYVSDGPLANNVNLNNGAMANTMPNVNAYHGLTQQGSITNMPKEVHPLNDAIFAAAKSLANRPQGRRRIIYVVSDGKEYGSSIKYKDLIKYLQTNNIAVYATVVGDSATPYVGFLNKFHIPYTMRENILPRYVAETGGEAVSEFRMRGIEQSFQKIAEEVRVQYTAGYYSNEPLTDGKYRTLEVQVLKPDLEVIAKKGYYPSPKALRPASAK